jgi:hypothetical protein
MDDDWGYRYFRTPPYFEFLEKQTCLRDLLKGNFVRECKKGRET